MRFGWIGGIIYYYFYFLHLTELNLICGIWALPIIRDRPLGSSGTGLHFELASGGPGTHHFFGLGEWAGEPVFLTLSISIPDFFFSLNFSYSLLLLFFFFLSSSLLSFSLSLFSSSLFLYVKALPKWDILGLKIRPCLALSNF